MSHCCDCEHHSGQELGWRGKVNTRESLINVVNVSNPQSLACATPNGCPIAPCHGGTGHAKGRGENGVGSVTTPGLAGLALPDCSALHPAARQWLETVAKGRWHGETKDKPGQVWHKARPCVPPRPLQPFAMATGSQGRASRQWRLTLETNRSCVPAHSAGHALPRTTSPDRLGLALDDPRMARHLSRDDRCQDVEDPAPPTPLLEQRQDARDQQLCRRFRARAPRAEASDLTREERRRHPHHHVRKIVALSDISDPQAVAYAAFSSASIANLLAQRARFTPEASARHLTRRDALLEGRRAPPARSMSQAPLQPEHHDTSEADPHVGTQSPAIVAHPAERRCPTSGLSEPVM